MIRDPAPSVAASLLEVIPYVVFWKDRESRYLGCNHAFAELAGLDDPSDIVGLDDFDMPWSEEEARGYRADDAKVMASGEPKLHIIETQMNAQGKNTYLDTSKVPLRDKHGEVIGVLGIYADITELMEAREAALAASRAKTAFLANMSHEIRTPMNAIIGFADVLEHSQPRPDQVEPLTIIGRQAAHLLEIINDILDLSKIEEGHLKLEVRRVAPGPLLREVHQLSSLSAQEKALQFEVHVAPDLPEAMGADPTRMRQILLNLLSNAIKFTERGAVTLAARREGDTLVVDVADQGAGIASEHLDRIFDSFEQEDASTTRRFGGTGLGLAISRRLARLMGGDLVVRSTVGQGSTFTLSLPIVAPPQVQDSPNEPIRKTASLQGRRVLLAEDGVDNQRLLEHILGHAGVDVTIVANGQDAVDAVLKGPDPFDVVLMDMQMPIMDGYASVRHLRAHGVDVPIVALTANAMVEDRERCLAAGCDDFLSKPVRPRGLLDMVSAWMPQDD